MITHFLIVLLLVLLIEAKRPLPYCAYDADLKMILNRTKLELGRSKRSVSWPFNSFHASIIMSDGKPVVFAPLFKCCTSCMGEFDKCALALSPERARFMCPSEGLNCILKCKNRHDRSGRFAVPCGKRLRKLNKNKKGRGKSHRKSKSGKYNPCEKLVYKNGKRCIQKLCIPLKFS